MTSIAVQHPILYLFIARDSVSKSGALGRSITQRRPRGDIPASPEILPQSCLLWEPNLSTADSVSGRAISSLPSRAQRHTCLRRTRRLHGNLDAQSNGKNDCPRKEKYLTAITAESAPSAHRSRNSHLLGPTDAHVALHAVRAARPLNAALPLPSPGSLEPIPLLSAGWSGNGTCSPNSWKPCSAEGPAREGIVRSKPDSGWLGCLLR
jgi:hypothetical protein